MFFVLIAPFLGLLGFGVFKNYSNQGPFTSTELYKMRKKLESESTIKTKDDKIFSPLFESKSSEESDI